MSRISACFNQLRQARRTALIPFITAGDPMPTLTVPLMQAMVDAGADMLELGIPFSDPMADGPAIQKANERALVHGVSLKAVLAMVAEFRTHNTTTPIILMGYLNPVEIMGYAQFAEAAARAGVDGVILVDLPPEEAGELLPLLTAHQLDPIFLLAPTTTDTRIQTICQQARGFVYYVSLKGVTGAAHLDVAAVTAKLQTIRSITALPVGVGFGIRDAATAARIGVMADAVVVGSALVNIIAAHADIPEQIIPPIVALLQEMRQAMDQARLNIF